VSVTRHRDGVGASRETASRSPDDTGAGIHRPAEDDTRPRIDARGVDGTGASIDRYTAHGKGVRIHEHAADDTGARSYRYEVSGWGVGELTVRDGLLLAHALPSARRQLERQPRASPPGRPPQGGASTPEVTLAANLSRESDGFVPDLCRRFAAHLTGTVVSYDDVQLDEERLTPFQQELLRAARSVQWGEVVTYGGLAALAGRPRAARAAGSFCAQSRLSLVVPCHRIVATGKGEPFEIGSYGPAGLRLKRRLLAVEGTLL
jgi:methylated-DNA-[protein]-cysteine S-methyltransferase